LVRGFTNLVASEQTQGGGLTDNVEPVDPIRCPLDLQDKKCCPKCGVPQSYSEFHDKKKRCQTCGVEFRILQAWGDVGQEFITRMTDAVRTQAEKKEQIRVQVMAEETQSNRLAKTARQRFYEKQMIQKNSQRTFLDRNYTPSSSSKVKQAEQEIQARLGGKRTPA
jgi:thioesterase domain-containing protein